jgi:hypothetical protein
MASTRNIRQGFQTKYLVLVLEIITDKLTTHFSSAHGREERGERREERGERREERGERREERGERREERGYSQNSDGVARSSSTSPAADADDGITGLSAVP